MVMRSLYNIFYVLMVVTSYVSTTASDVGSTAAASQVAEEAKRISSTLKAIERPIDVAIDRAEKNYFERRGSFLKGSSGPTYFNLLLGPREVNDLSELNPYLQELRICEKYWVKAQIHSNSSFEGVEQLIEEYSISDKLLDAKIYFIPVMNARRDYFITAWECITNLKISNNATDIPQNDAGNATSAVPLVTWKKFPFEDYTQHPFLEKCMYVPSEAQGGGTIWDGVVNAASTGACS